MALPMPRTTLRVLEPGGFLPGKAIHQHVRPAVAVEVVSESEETIRIGVVHPQRALEARHRLFHAVGLLALEGGVGGIDFVPLLEIRPFIPVSAGDDIHLAVVIEIADSRAFGPELVGSPDLLEAVKQLAGCRKQRRSTEENCRQKNSNHGTMVCSRSEEHTSELQSLRH